MKFSIFLDKIFLEKTVVSKKCQIALTVTRLKSTFSIFTDFLISNMYSLLFYFMNKCNLNSKSQHGHLRGRSTNIAIYPFITSILHLLEKTDLALRIFLHLNKAYECVSKFIDHKYSPI